MATFAKIAKPQNAEAGPRKAPRKVILQPGAFADTWYEKPREAVCIGVRLVSSADVQAARAIAAEQVKAWYTDRKDGGYTDEAAATEAYNDAIMRHLVARATCDVNDVSKAYFPRAEDTIRDALTEEGIRLIWDEIVILHGSTAVGIPQANDADAARLGRILVDGDAINALGPSETLEVRTILGYVLTILVGTGRAREADVDDDSTGYVVRSARE